MAIYKVRLFGDPVLREKSQKIVTVDRALEKLAAHMAEIMREEAGIGLAAPQIGVLRQIIVVGMTEEDFVAYINPEIIERSNDQEVDDEGCLCVPDIRVPVFRAAKVVAKALDLRGREVEIEAEDLLARVLQHECDHLHGITILDRTDQSNRGRAIREFMESRSGGR